ncbi:MAG: tetratricopeptide repeat protein [Nitrospirae bacterium]|nr:tetratricopeptide repeat protein [Nitrospirota bacterium]
MGLQMGNDDKIAAHAVGIAVILLVGTLVYSNTFNVPFVYDDQYFIARNKLIKNFDYFMLPSTVENTFFGVHFKNRIAAYFTLALNYKLGGLHVRGYHVFNLIVHLSNALLLYWFVLLSFKTDFAKTGFVKNISEKTDFEKLDPSNPDFVMKPGGTVSPEVFKIPRTMALFAALLFVSHPLMTEAVTYVIQRFSSLAAFFCLLSLCAYCRWRISVNPAAKWLFYILSVASSACAMKTKESAFTLPLIITVFEFMFFGGKADGKGRGVNSVNRILYLIPILMTTLIIPVGNFSVRSVSDVAGVYRETGMSGSGLVSRKQYLMTEFSVILTYLKLLVVPEGQNFDYDFPIYDKFLNPNVYLPLLVLLSIMFAGAYLFYRSAKNGSYFYRMVAFGIVQFFLALAVESGIVPLSDVICEYRVYWASFGFFLCLATGMEALRQKMKTRKTRKTLNMRQNNETVFIEKSAIIVLILLVVYYSLGTYSRNILWQNKILLFEDTIKKSPNKARPHLSLGAAYAEYGRYDEAGAQYKKALSLKPAYVSPETFLNMGGLYAIKGQFANALSMYKILLLLYPKYSDGYNDMGVVYYKQGQPDVALKYFNTAVMLQPENIVYYINIGKVYVAKGTLDKASATYGRILQIEPGLKKMGGNADDYKSLFR